MSEGAAPGWPIVRLREVADDISYGYTASASAVAVGPRMLRITDIQDNRVDWSAVPHCVCPSPEKHLLKAGDIVVARTGATTGKSFLLNDVPEPAVFASYLIRIKPSSRVMPAYLATYMRSPSYWSQISVVSKGTAQPGANASILGNLEVPLPPVVEQRKIVQRVDSLQTRSRRARTALDAVPPLLEKLRQSILAAAFRGDLTKDWRAKNKNVEPATELLARIHIERRKKWEQSDLAKMKSKGRPPSDDRWKGKYKEPERVDTAGLAKLPSGWCWASLDELTFIVGGITKSQRRRGTETLRAVPYVRVANVQRGHLRLDEMRTIEATEDQIADLLLMPGDVLLNEGGDRDKLGRGWVWEGQLVECIHQNHVFRARAIIPELQPKYVSHYANQLGQAFFVDQGKQTTNLASVSMSRVRRFPIALPPAVEQAAIIAVLDERLGETSNVRHATLGASTQLTALERAVLAKAFRGELLPQDPREESAETMVARSQ